MNSFSKTFDWIWLILLGLTPIILWLLPADFFDHGDLIVCPSRLFFDIECFGCGMTRAIMHLHHFDFEEAFFYNYGSLVIYPALVVVWVIWMKAALKKVELIK